MKDDIINVLKVVFLITALKYLWRALCNLWSIWVVFWNSLAAWGAKSALERKIIEKKQLGKSSAGDLYELEMERRRCEESEQDYKKSKASNPGFFVSAFMLVVNVVMFTFCIIPMIGFVSFLLNISPSMQNMTFPAAVSAEVAPMDPAPAVSETPSVTSEVTPQ